MLRTILDDIRRKVDGSVAISVIGSDGIAVESINDKNVPLDVLGVEFSGFVKSIRPSTAELNTGEVRSFSVVTEKYAAHLASVTPEYFVLLVLQADGNQGRARFELTRAKQRLRDALR